MTATTSSLYDELVASGAEIDHHESDLYVKATPETRAIIMRHREPMARSFRHQVSGEIWFDIPFAFALAP